MKTKEEYIKKGYNIIYSDKEYTTLERPKQFSLLALILWGLFTGIGFIIYPLYYIGKSTDKVTIKR